MERDGKGHYGQLAVALSQRVCAISRGGGGGGGDGDSDDDDDWDMSEDDWSEDEEEEEMGLGLFDEVSDVPAKPCAVGRYTAAQLTDAKKPTITLTELSTIFTAQKEVRLL